MILIQVSDDETTFRGCRDDETIWLVYFDTMHAIPSC